MILIDLSQVMIATLMVQISSSKFKGEIVVEQDLLRHMILNVIRANRIKFGHEYGEVVICCDGAKGWRKKLFPYYKARRKINKDASPLNWTEFFKMMNVVRDELRDYFPYKVLHIETAEADDIIAVLTKKLYPDNKILILSGDKDFQQLQQYLNVYQYSPVLKKYIKCKNADRFLLEHILRGDVGDGIPNVLSPDDVFVSGGRQKPLTEKKLAVYLTQDLDRVMTAQVKRNFNRNQQLVDFNFIPEVVSQEILEQWENPPGASDRSKIFNYFISRKLRNLMEYLNDF